MTTTSRVQHISNGLCSYALRPAQGVLRIRYRSPRCVKSPQFAKLTTLGLSSRASRCDVVKSSKSVQTCEVWAQRLRAFGSNSDSQLKAATALVFGVALVLPDAAHAFSIHQEPDNALSFPTWVIHISSVIEWIVAMALVWRYAEVTGEVKMCSSLLHPLLSCTSSKLSRCILDLLVPCDA